MSFLAPLFIFGALAVAAPILFHLIRRTTQEQTPFSSLMFLLPTPPRVTKKSRLDNILLLILRCLVLGLLALGFARPFIKRPMAAEPDAQSTTKVILLVDASASMKRENLWSQAVDRVGRVLRGLDRGDQVAIYRFDQQTYSVVNFIQWAEMDPNVRVDQSLERLREAKPSWAGTSLGSALNTAVEAFEDANKQEHVPGTRRIVLVSDLQEGSRLDGLQGYEWPRGVEVTIERVEVDRPSNAGIQLMSTAEDAATDEASAAMRVRISNSLDATREKFKLEWANGTSLAELYVPPGQSRTLPIPEDVSGGDRLVLSGDEADFDNTMHLVPPKTEELRILFLGDEDKNDPDQGLFYLTRALQDTRRQKMVVITKSNADPLTPANVADVHLIVVADALSEERATAVRRLLDQGKTVLLTMKTPAIASTLSKLAGVGNLPAEEARVSDYAMLGQIDFTHPLFAPFVDPRFSDFTKINVWKYRRINASALPNARVLAKFDNPEKDAAILQVPAGEGSIFVLTFGWFRSDSQLARSTKFVPLLYSFLEQSGAIKALTAQYLIGDPVDLSTLRSTDAIAVRKPDGTEVAVEDGSRFTQTDLPGVYSVPTVQPAMHFAVNLRPEESKTEPMPIETLEKLGVPLKIEGIRAPKQAERIAQARLDLQATELERRQKLWRWLIVAALMVLMIETWMAGRITRRATLTEATV